MVTATRKAGTSPVIHENGRYGGGNHGNGSFGGRELFPDSAQIGLLAFMATVIMLFAGFFSSLLIRRAAPDWRPIFLPAVLWMNTAVLLISSFTLELSRRSARNADRSGARLWITATALLGAGFLAGQISAWRLMAAHGVFLPSNPHASFFYILTGLHGLHLLGGLVVLALASLKAWSRLPLERLEGSLKLSAIYWHFLDALWLVLFFLVLKL